MKAKELSLVVAMYNDLLRLAGLEVVRDRYPNGQPAMLVYNDGDMEGEPVCEGDVVEDRDGRSWTVTGGHAPRHINSSGRIFVVPYFDDCYTQELTYFPSVFDAVWIPESDPAYPIERLFWEPEYDEDEELIGWHRPGIGRVQD